MANNQANELKVEYYYDILHDSSVDVADSTENEIYIHPKCCTYFLMNLLIHKDLRQKKFCKTTTLLTDEAISFQYPEDG